MNKNIRKFSAILIVLMLFLGVTVLVVSADPPPPPPEDVEGSIVAGLEWLAGQQDVDGHWGGWECNRVGRAGLAVLKFETRAVELGLDPLSEEYEYHLVVKKGLEYILDQAHIVPIGLQPAGDPDGNGNGTGMLFNEFVCAESSHDIYNTGIAMMAIAASTNPEFEYGGAELEYYLQEAVDYMSWAQTDEPCGAHRGGWRYQPDCQSDNSNSGYATLGLGFAQAPPPYGFGLTVPQFVKDELNIWIGVMQNPVDGDIRDGGSYYTPYGSWENILKTGNLIYEMGLTGDTAETLRVLDAVDFIERHWSNPQYCGSIEVGGWLNEYQAMFAMMKGFESLGIDLIDLDDDSIPEWDWFAEVSQHIVDTQVMPGGYWPSDCWGDNVLTTAWALLTLEKTVPVFEIPVPFDVHPGSCPNPFNMGKKGVMPAAIAGTMDLDVYMIDPASLQLQVSLDEGAKHVAPLRWAYEDAAQPFEPYLEKELERDFCLEYEEGDGYMDLTLKFKAQEVAGILPDGVADGDVVKLFITGTLKAEFGGTPIMGEDVIWIHKKK